MTSFTVKNNAESAIVDNPLLVGSTTANLATGGGDNLPSTFPFRLTLWDETTYPDPSDDPGMEIVECTNRVADVLTITRAMEDTTAFEHTVDSRVALLITAGHFNDSTYGITTRLDELDSLTCPGMTVYVSKCGDDSTGNGSLAKPFLTINAGNNYAISLLNPTRSWDEFVVVKVSPGIYTEQIADSHGRVFIVGEITNFEQYWSKDTVLYNTGADAAHYPIGNPDRLNLVGITVKVDTDGVYGQLVNRGIFSLCTFQNGHFITNTSVVSDLTAYFNFCYFDEGGGFNLTGNHNEDIFLALRNCDIDGGTTLFGSTGSSGTTTVKFERSKINCNLNIGGNWGLVMQHTEMYTNAELDFDTDGYIDIFSCILINKVHFTTDTAETKKLVNCLFRYFPADQGDVTSDVDVEFIEYSGNHQDNGINGTILTVSKIKNVGGGQNKYRNINEALAGCKNIDSIVNLEGDIEITTPLVVPPNVDVQIDGNKKWKITSTHATTLIEIGDNQHVAFVDMKEILGGKLATINGTNAKLSFQTCGRFSEPIYVNIEINSGDTDSGLCLLETAVRGTAAPAIKVSDVDVLMLADRSYLRGATTYPAIEYTVENDRMKGKFTTFIHGDNNTHPPMTYSGANKVDLAIYSCAMNAALASANFNNTIVNANNTISGEIDF